MKSRKFFLTLLLTVLMAGNYYAQSSTPAREKFDLTEAEWAVLFPPVPECELKNLMTYQIGDIVQIYASYDWKRNNPAAENRPPTNYICGKIEYVFSISGKTIKPKFSDYKPSPFYIRFKIKTFDAYEIRPRCGVGSPGSVVNVYFEKDKKLSVTDKADYGFFKFAKKANYAKLKTIINTLAGSLKNVNIE